MSGPSLQDRQRLVANSLHTPRPPNAGASMSVGDEYEGAVVTANVLDIQFFNNNPRTVPNPEYEALKAGIRANGLEQPFKLTKRPGSSQYMVAKGGNTRLQIMQELFLETGEIRFKSLTTLFTAWVSESAAIIHHLNENDQRGGNSFWDKAKGIQAFKRELEKEHTRQLSVNEIVKEIKQHGSSYSQGTVQAYLFAAENLDPIGPWLSNTAVQTSIRPTLSELNNLATNFEKSAEVKAALQDALMLQGEILRSQANEAMSPGDVSLDVEELVQTLASKAAMVFEVPVEKLGDLVAARATNPRISKAELVALAASTSAATAAPSSRRPTAAPVTRPPKQAPAAGQQLPLQPAMLAGVPPSQVDSAPLNSVPQGQTDASVASTSTAPADAEEAILHAVSQIGQLAELDDVLQACHFMPLGFYVEIPTTGIELIDGHEQRAPRDRALRQATWHVLASLSGQFDETLCAQLPRSESPWRASQLDGRLGVEFAMQTLGVTKDGAPFVSAADIHLVFFHPQIGPLMADLWSKVMQLRASAPGRFPERLQLIPLVG